MAPSSVLLAARALLLSGLLVGTAQAQTLRPQWAQDPATGRWYGALVPGTSWSAARQWARQHGSTLVCVGSSAENQWVSSTFDFFAPYGVWLGLSDADVEGAWSWEDSQAVVWTGWAPGEPSPANSDLKDAAYASGGAWTSDAPSTGSRLGAVEQAARPGRGYSLPRLVDTVPTGGISAVDCATGDVDGDGHPDLVVVHDANTGIDAPICCYLRPGGALPGTAVTTPSGWWGNGTRVSLADVDGDGRLDASLTNLSHQYVDVRAGDGAGGFAPLATLAAGAGLRQSAWIDIDGDLDLALLACEQALVIRPSDAETRRNFASALKVARYPQDAVEQIELFLASKPADTALHLAAAGLYAGELDDTAKARTHYESVLALEPSHPQAAAIRGWLASHPR